MQHFIDFDIYHTRIIWNFFKISVMNILYDWNYSTFHNYDWNDNFIIGVQYICMFSIESVICTVFQCCGAGAAAYTGLLYDTV